MNYYMMKILLDSKLIAIKLQHFQIKTAFHTSVLSLKLEIVHVIALLDQKILTLTCMPEQYNQV